MQITLFSFFISIVWSSFLIIAIYLCRKTRFFIYQFGVTSLVLLYLFCIVRLALPLDFVFTKGVPLKGVYSDIYEYMVIDKIGDSKVSVISILFCLWIAVSVALIFRLAYQYNITMRKVSTYAIRKDVQCNKVFERVMNNSKKKMKINVRYSDEVNVPIGVGLLDKSIILPDEIYSDKELYCILMHEYTHFLNRDLLVKILTHIFCCIFWWNPIVYLLRRDLSQTLEIKCDLCVTEQMDNKSKADYLTTIVSIWKKADETQKKTILCGTTELVSTYCKSEIVERFKIVSEKHKWQNKNKFLTIAWLFAFLAFFIFSYSFVFQPCYEPPINEIETESGVHEIRSDNSYIIKNKDDTYTLVMPSGKRQNIDEKFVIDMKKKGFKVIEERK